MIVWRWEHKVSCHGPYNPRGDYNPELERLTDMLGCLHDKDPLRVVSSVDGLDTLGWPYGEWRIACRFRGELIWWFQDVPEGMLRSAGYVMRAYRVAPHYVHLSRSGRQVAFDASRAVLVKTF